MPVVVGCGCTKALHQAPTTNTYCRYTMAHFLVCVLLRVRLLCFSFTAVALLWLIRAQFFIITQSGEAATVSEQNQRPSTSKFVSGAVAIHHRLQALRSQHTQTHTHAKIHSRRKTTKKEQINLLQPAVCAFMCSTPFDSNPQEHETLCVPQEARKNETHSDLPPQEYMGAKTVQFYTSIRCNSKRPRQNTALQNVDKRFFQTSQH